MIAVPPLITEADERFELRPSAVPGAGLGVFARVALPGGTELEIIGPNAHKRPLGRMWGRGNSPEEERA